MRTYAFIGAAVVLLAGCDQPLPPMSEPQALSADLMPASAAKQVIAAKLGADWAERPFVDNFVIGCPAVRHFRYEDITDQSLRFVPAGILQIYVSLGGAWDCGGIKQWNVSAADVPEIRRALRALGARVN
jgi:hypothetical protein